MDTVLNLGMNDKAVKGLSSKTGNRVSHGMLTDVLFKCLAMLQWVFHLKDENAIDEIKNAKGVKLDTELDAADLEKLVANYKTIYQNIQEKAFARSS